MNEIKIYSSLFIVAVFFVFSIKTERPISESRSLGYFKPFCGAVPRSPRLINAVTVTHLPYPWIVPIIILYNPSDYVVNTKLCTGTIIHHRYILTAASCFNKIEDKKSSLRIGFDIVNITALYSGQNMQEIKIVLNKNLFLHPEYTVYRDEKYKRSISMFDFAIIKLDIPTSIQPACVPYNLENPYSYPREGSILRAYSWGKLAQIAQYPDYLAGTKFRVTTDHECKSEYTNPSYDSRYLLCGKNSKFKTCVYMGDVGAGVYVVEKGIVAIAGIVTSGQNDESCELPDYFQRVSTSVDWIKSITLSKKHYN